MSQASEPDHAEPVTVSVRILDRDYQVNCSAEERGALESAARTLDQRMREIRTSGRIVGLERIAVMAALNLSHECLVRDAELAHMRNATQDEVDRLERRLGAVLAELDPNSRA